MKAHPRVIAYLQRAASHEFSAVQQLTLQAVQAEMLGLVPLASELRQGVQEEIQHAEQFVGQMLRLGVMPCPSQLRALPVGRTHAELLRFGLATEAEAIRLYREASQFCERITDQDNCALFTRILADEVQHHSHIEGAIKALGP